MNEDNQQTNGTELLSPIRRVTSSTPTLQTRMPTLLERYLTSYGNSSGFEYVTEMDELKLFRKRK